MAASFARLAGFGLAVLLLLLCYFQPLRALVRFAAGSPLYSYILLVPVLSAALAWTRRKSVPPPGLPDELATVLAALLGLILLAGAVAVRRGATSLPTNDLALITLSFVAFLVATVAAFWGRAVLRHLAPSLGFLAFLAPWPAPLEQTLETLLQTQSAGAAFLLFRLAGTPVLREGLSLHLPGITLEVAPECSGIHSTLVLLVTSVLIGQLLLATAWKRAVLALLVLPFGILRNGLRIFTLGELCTRFDPALIDSPLHRHGGPLFFLLALVPFLACALLLARSERAPDATSLS
jgi:exosortase C (VPDSG-CTERM-specific)